MMNFCKYSSALLLEQFLLYLNILLQVCALIKVLLAYARKRNMDLCMWSSSSQHTEIITRYSRQPLDSQTLTLRLQLKTDCFFLITFLFPGLLYVFTRWQKQHVVLKYCIQPCQMHTYSVFQCDEEGVCSLQVLAVQLVSRSCK